jgi:putative spermidine/putrescine transport system substrate-binding protein
MSECGQRFVGSSNGSTRPSRRRFLRSVAAAGLAVASAPVLVAQAAESADNPSTAPYVKRSRRADRIVYATWGGTWEDAMRKAWFDPFTQKTGIEVVTAQGPDYGKIEAMVKAGRTEWDVAEVNADFPIIARKKGLAETIDWSASGLKDLKDQMVSQSILNDLSVPQLTWAMVIAYNTNRFSASSHPMGWADVWDVLRFPGKRTFGSGGGAGLFEAALLADGAPADQLYPIDVDRALNSLSKIRDNIIWYDTGAQQVQYWTQEQAVTGLGWDGRVIVARESGAPIDIEYNQSFLTWTDLVIPKGAPNKELALQFLTYTLTPEAQAAVCNLMPYGPTNRIAFDLLSPDRAKVVSGGSQMQGKYIAIDNDWWAENLESVQEQFNAWRVGG